MDLDRLTQLQQTVDRLTQVLAGQHRVVITPQTNPVYLGQPINLRVQARGLLDDKPAAGAQITLSTSWGILLSSQGLQLRKGKSLTLRVVGEKAESNTWFMVFKEKLTFIAPLLVTRTRNRKSLEMLYKWSALFVI